jgi:uncharacterized protein Usg
MKDIEKLLLHDYRLTTAEIIYHLPDHPSLLQAYIWQEYDLTPNFPTLKKFLNFWDKQLEGKIHCVKVRSCELICSNTYFARGQDIVIH